jgi:DNA repair exonuclease SbcCD ATPase subunit
MKNTWYIFLASLCLFSACGAKVENAEPMADTVTDEQLVTAENKLTQNQLAATPQPQRDLYSDGKPKLIKTVNYRFEVENVKRATENIEVAIKKYPAYISASNLHLENPILENKLTIRVQSEFFYDLLKDIDKEARFVNFRDVNTTDASKEFVDLESRLKTKREVEERYMDILRKKAGSIEELLEAERQIGALHEEIEATISRMNYLKEQISYSTINLEFYQTISQEVAAADTITWKDKFGDAMKTGWEGLITIIVALVYIWPILVAAGLIVIYLKFFRRKPMPFKQV